jgi:hypothetical protein
VPVVEAQNMFEFWDELWARVLLDCSTSVPKSRTMAVVVFIPVMLGPGEIWMPDMAWDVAWLRAWVNPAMATAVMRSIFKRSVVIGGMRSAFSDNFILVLVDQSVWPEGISYRNKQQDFNTPA